MERTPFAFELKIDKQNQSYNRLRRILFEHLVRQSPLLMDEDGPLFASFNIAG